MPTLFIQLSDIDPTDAVAWWFCEDGQEVRSGTAQLSKVVASLELADSDLQQLDIVALLPDGDVFFTHVDVPGRNPARIKQATPYAVEPMLAEDLETVHIATGAVKRGEPVPVAIMNRERLREYLALFESADLMPRVATSAGLLIGDSVEPHVIETKDEITIRLRDQLAVVDPDSLSSVLAASIAADPSVAGDENPQVFHCVGSDRLRDVLSTALTQAGHASIELNHTTFESFLGARGDVQQAVNMLQGEFEPVARGPSIKRMWNRTAAVIAGSVLVLSCALVAQGAWANWQTSKLQAQALDVYESAYGTRAVSGNPVFRMQERMGARMDRQSAFLRLLDGVTSAATQVELTNIDYNENQSRMTVTFYAANFAEFEALRKKLEERGLTIDVNVAEQQRDRVWARITVTTP